MKKIAGLLVGMVAVVGFGVGVSAERPGSTATASPAEVDSKQTFSVTFTPCFGGETVRFEFQGQQQEVPCPIPVDAGLAEGSQGLVDASASASFTAPEAPGNYTGTATALDLDRLVQGIRRPAAVARPSGAAACSPPNCATFSVTVRQATTTTAATTTTSTTVAPTTSAVGAVPPAPTTTVVAPSLPATGPSQNDNTATVAIVLVVVGAALIMVARRRGSQGAV